MSQAPHHHTSVALPCARVFLAVSCRAAAVVSCSLAYLSSSQQIDEMVAGSFTEEDEDAILEELNAITQVSLNLVLRKLLLIHSFQVAVFHREEGLFCPRRWHLT